MFALVDCNNFYASCERVFRPDLNGKPIVVLSNNDGCVIARSNEAKKLGVPMGAPAFKHKVFFQQKNIVVFSSNYALYGDMSARIMDVLANFAPEIEIYSIDEAFLKFEITKGVDFKKYGLEIKNKTTKSVGVPVSIGFAKTKALAKVANRIAKKFPDRTQGVYVIDNEKNRIKALKWLEIDDVWGIGARYAKKMKEYGIYKAYDFTQQTDDWVKKNMSIVGLRLKRELEGKPTLTLEKTKAKKNIATTRTFDANYTTYEQLKERIVTFTVNCARKLRQQQSHCNALTVFIRTNRNRQDLQQYSQSVQVKLPFPTNSDIELAKFALSALQQIFKKGYHYKKAGVIIMGITPEAKRQINLFHNSNPKHQPLMKVIDKINTALGQKKVKLGSQDISKTWKMHQKKLSPRYTTQLTDIINVKV